VWVKLKKHRWLKAIKSAVLGYPLWRNAQAVPGSRTSSYFSAGLGKDATEGLSNATHLQTNAESTGQGVGTGATGAKKRCDGVLNTPIETQLQY